MKSHALRVLPNGEFGVGLYRKFSPAAPPVSPGVPKREFSASPESGIDSIEHGAVIYGSLSSYLQATAPGFAPAVLAEVAAGLVDAVGGSASLTQGGSGGGSPLGLSNATNSHKRAKRGTSGLTSYAKKMLRNGCWLLERTVRRGGVGMITCTIPSSTKETQRLIVSGWAEILRIFTQWLSRRLKAAGSQNPAVLGVTEIQERRRQKEGGLPLHLHLVFASRVGKAHIVSRIDVSDAWERAVCSVVPCAKNLQWNASTRVETVKKSVARYLCKYMSKGSPEAMQQAVSEGFEMPSAWWFMVGKMKRVIKSLTVYRTDSVASEVWYQCIRKAAFFDYIVPVNVSIGGEEVTVGFAGKASGAVLEWMRSTA